MVNDRLRDRLLKQGLTPAAQRAGLLPGTQRARPGRHLLPQHDALDEQLVGQLVEQARASGLQLTGEGGLLQRLTVGLLRVMLRFGGRNGGRLVYKADIRPWSLRINRSHMTRAKSYLIAHPG